MRNTHIFLGAAIGIVGGIGVHLVAGGTPGVQAALYASGLISSLFIGLLKMIVIPLIFVSITNGIANLKADARMHRVWIFTLLYFLGASSLAILLGMTAVNLVKPGVGLHLDMFNTAAPVDTKSLSLAQFAQTFIDNLFMNPIAAMAKTEVLPTVLFAMFIGIALVALDNKARTTRRLLSEALTIILTVVDWIMRLAPVGIAALLFKMTATQDLTLLGSVAAFVGVVVGSTLVHGIIVLPLLLWIFTRTNPVFFFKSMADSLITAFSTSSSSATMPVTLRCVQDHLKVKPSIAGFVVPLGTTINMDGTAMYEAIAAIFVANLVGIELNLIQQLVVFWTAMLASIGAPGIPSAGMVTMIMVLQSVGLPVEAIAILLPIDRPLDTIRTVVNVEGDAVGSMIVQKLTQETGFKTQDT